MSGGFHTCPVCSLKGKGGTVVSILKDEDAVDTMEMFLDLPDGEIALRQCYCRTCGHQWEAKESVH